jgi:hypothetical protein
MESHFKGNGLSQSSHFATSILLFETEIFQARVVIYQPFNIPWSVFVGCRPTHVAQVARAARISFSNARYSLADFIKGFPAL